MGHCIIHDMYNQAHIYPTIHFSIIIIAPVLREAHSLHNHSMMLVHSISLSSSTITWGGGGGGEGGGGGGYGYIEPNRPGSTGGASKIIGDLECNKKRREGVQCRHLYHGCCDQET